MRARVYAVAVLVALAPACGGGDGGPGPAPVPTTVVITPGTASLVSFGATVTLVAQARDASGNPVSGAVITWSTSDALVASVTSSGLVEAEGNGNATITASTPGASGSTVTGTATVTVAQAVSAGASTVTVTPTTTIPADGSTQATITVTTRDAQSNPMAGVTVQLAVTGTGTLTLVQPSAVTNASGVATGTLTSNTFGTKNVSAMGGTVAIVQTADVVYGASQIAWTNPPDDFVSGASAVGTAAVSLRDAAGNTVTTGTQPVTIALVSHPSLARLYGITTVNAVAGVATFNDYGIDFPASGFFLTATSGTMLPVTSAPFNVTGAVLTALGAVLTGVSNCDDCVALAALPIGFVFTFYGNAFGSVNVSSNGFAAFSTAGVTTFTNSALPSATAPNGVVAPLWDDLMTSDGCAGTQGTIYTTSTGAAPNLVFVIQYRTMPFFVCDGTSQNFDILLYQASGDIEFRYGTLSNVTRGSGSQASIGIENGTGTVGIQVGLNTAGIVRSGVGMRFRYVSGNYLRVR